MVVAGGGGGGAANRGSLNKYIPDLQTPQMSSEKSVSLIIYFFPPTGLTCTPSDELSVFSYSCRDSLDWAPANWTEDEGLYFNNHDNKVSKHGFEYQRSSCCQEDSGRFICS